MNRNLLIFFILVHANLLCSQNKMDTIFMDENWEKTDRLNSSYFRILSKKSNGLYHYKDYWITGELQMEGNLSELFPETKEGKFIWYNKEGGISQLINYKNNKVIGSIKKYNIEGYDVIEYMPILDSLDNYDEINKFTINFSNFVAKHLKYPDLARENDIEGRVLIEFYLGANGIIIDQKVKEPVYKVLDDEAMRIVSLYKWPTPIYKKKPTMIKLTLPIRFILTD
ncbi:MAG: energy transducer TonB [Saprospiraceae bacterium]|uniref:Energy transducer TonB n=1 Tax=Candidatus Defluviibacterium haderslevense TaxID=2981993 RepID=A0A9D7XCK1_9BACT|nr:energy transducer TonB [Candidatus Defluviibacterium haderslevense]MBL0236074.1 energy transducer TonB [Candidatus Defluviibacterium haderslevense]